MFTQYIEPQSMLFSDLPITPPPTARPAPPLTIDDINRQLIRIETRLVKLMHHMGLDTHGDPL